MGNRSLPCGAAQAVISGPDRASLEVSRFIGPPAPVLRAVAVEDVLGHLRVFFRFYELAVLPMYLLIGIWGSSGEVRPRGPFAWAFRETGVGTKDYPSHCAGLFSARPRGAGARDVGAAEPRDWSWSASPYNPTPSKRKDFIPLHGSMIEDL